jgi:hypothetical protein
MAAEVPPRSEREAIIGDGGNCHRPEGRQGEEILWQIYTAEPLFEPF